MFRHIAMLVQLYEIIVLERRREKAYFHVHAVFRDLLQCHEKITQPLKNYIKNQ